MNNLQFEKYRLETQLKEVNELSKMTVPVITGWKNKAIHCIASARHYLTTIDILACVFGADKYNALSVTERREHVTNLSVTLSNLVKEGHIGKARMNGMKGNYYGLPEWFEKDGSMKLQFADMTLYYMINSAKNRMSCCEDEISI